MDHINHNINTWKMPSKKISQSDSQLKIEKRENDSFGVEKEQSKKDRADDTQCFQYKEGGWGWVLVLATAYCFSINIGMMNNYALIHDKFIVVYNSTRNQVFYSGVFLSIDTKQNSTLRAYRLQLRSRIRTLP